jgi:ferredoxin
MQATRDTESATALANSNRFSLAHRLAKNGIDATPAACASIAIGAVNSRFA